MIVVIFPLFEAISNCFYCYNDRKVVGSKLQAPLEYISEIYKNLQRRYAFLSLSWKDIRKFPSGVFFNFYARVEKWSGKNRTLEVLC